MWSQGTITPPVAKRNPQSLASWLAGDSSYNTVRLTSLVNLESKRFFKI